MIEVKGKVRWADPLSKSLFRTLKVEAKGSGIFVLRGPNAVGKTTLLMAIAYALGDDTHKDSLERRGCSIDLHIGINGTSIDISRDASKYILKMNGKEISDPEDVKSIVQEFFDVAYVPVERIVGIRAITRIMREFRDASRKIREKSGIFLSEAETTLKEIKFYKRLVSKIDMLRKELEMLNRKLEASKEKIEKKREELNDLKRIKPLLEDLARTEKLPELETRLKMITKELEHKNREKRILVSMYEEKARELESRTTELKTKLEIVTKEIKRLREELEFVERDLERLVNRYEASDIPDLKKLATAIRKDNIEDVERMYRKSLRILSTLELSKLEAEKTLLERLLEVCRSSPDPSIFIHGLEMRVENLIAKLRQGLITVSEMLSEERKKEETWLKLKDACKDALELLKRRRRVKEKMKSLEDELKKLEVEYRSFKIRAVQRVLPPADEVRLEKLEREIEMLEREKHELLSEIEKLREILQNRDKIMTEIGKVAKKIGIKADEVMMEDLSIRMSKLEDEIETMEREMEQLKERIDEVKGKIVSNEEMLKEREKYVKHLLNEEKHIEELIRILQTITDTLLDVEKLSAEDIEDIKKYMEILKREKERKSMYQALYEVIIEMGKMIAELIGNIWDHEHGWLKVQNIDFERGVVILATKDGRTVERGLTEFSRGQLGLASILPMINKDTEARFGKVILVDEIGDLDPDRRMEIINHIRNRRENYGDICFAILVLPDVEVKMLDAEQNPDAIR